MTGKIKSFQFSGLKADMLYIDGADIGSVDPNAFAGAEIGTVLLYNTKLTASQQEELRAEYPKILFSF